MRAGSIRGVVLEAHPALPLFMAAMCAQGLGRTLAVGVVVLVLHELAHALAAHLLGMRVLSLELTLFGACAHLEGLREQVGARCALVALAGPAANALLAAAARASGIVIYCIGLVGSDGVDPNTLNEWATDPDASHVAVTPDAADLEELFADLAVNISKPGATQIVIDEEVNRDFAIISVSPPDKGSAVTVDAHKLQWKIDALGVTGNEGAALEFFVRHTGDTGGTKLVNLDIKYSDAEGNAVTFPNPSVRVDCRAVVNPEKCPTPVDVTVGGCQDSVLVDLGDAYLESLGRIVQLDVTVKNVCPGKRVALAMILTEVDQNGMEYQRGMKAFTLPAHSFPTCRDVLVRCVKFVLPEDLDVSGKSPRSLCGKRNLKVRVIAHNIDTDYRCCEAVVTL